MLRGIVSEIVGGWKFVSNIFIRPKPNNKVRLIIDLSPLNASILKEHFKMDNVESAIDLMKEDAYLASIDLQDAYYTLPVREADKPYLCFQWDSHIFMFNVMPFGLTSAPRFFTKILKPPMALLRRQGVNVFNYIDDLFIISNTREKCETDVQKVITLLTSLGFFVNYEKSSLKPSKSMRFLGFILDSEEMIVKPPSDKVEKTICLLQQFLPDHEFNIRSVASMIGILNDLSHSMDYAKAHVKGIENDKITALKLAGPLGFEGSMYISPSGRDDILWWLNNLEGACRMINVPLPTVTLKTDASRSGWGAVTGEKVINERWSEGEASMHINVLETLAVFKALECLFSDTFSTHFKLLTDNTTTMAYVNKAGGTWSLLCNYFAKQIWEWCQKRNNWITATFIAGKDNVEADFASRHFTADTEWGLNPVIFRDLCTKWFRPEVDLFASFNNHLLPVYVSWGPDKHSIATNAFLLNWGNFKTIYIFPPFRLLARCAKKILREKPKGFLIAPNWPGQVWFVEVMNLAKSSPLLIPSKPGNLIPKSKGNLRSGLHSTPLIAVPF